MKKMKMLASVLALALAVPAAASEVRLSVQQMLKAGLTASYTGSLLASNTYKVRNDGKVMLHLKKTGAGICTLTIVTPNTSQGLAISDQTVSIPATTGDVFVGPLPPSLFNDASSDVSFTFSDEEGLTIAAIRL